MKLRTKVFLIFFILATVPLLVITVFAYNRYVQTAHQRMDEITSNLFDNAREESNNILESIRETASMFTFYSRNDDSIISILSDLVRDESSLTSYDYYNANRQIQSTCQNILYSYEYIYGVYIYTPANVSLGWPGGSNGDLDPDYIPSTKTWYRDTMELDGGMYISSMEDHDLFTGSKSSVFFSQVLRDVYSGDFLGVLIVDCDPSIFNLSTVNTLPEMAVLTIDNTETSSVLYTNIDDMGEYYTTRNKRVMQEDLNISPLRLTAVFDYASLFQEYNVTGMLLLGIAVACSLGILVLALVVSKNIVYPVEHLSRKMATQRGHVLEQSTRYLKRGDEIGTLYNEYNSMVEELNTSVKRDYQDKLVILDAQMKSLEARINSHFLFNTLEAINSMAELEDNEQIATMSLALGNMFRYTIKTQSELVTVQDELNHVQDYVSIQTIRFDNRFHLTVDMPDSFRTKQVLKLILQPLVENSLYHGLNYCSTGDTISIKGYEKDDCLYLEVADNGTGMPAEQLADIQARLSEEASFTELGHRNKQSIGLKNIHSRMELYYGKGYGLTLKSKLGQGTTILIKLPNLQKEEA